MQGQLTIQGANGHAVIDYDTEVEGGTKEAQDEFDRIISANRGMGWAYAETATGEREQVKKFDPHTQAKVTIAPRMAGG